MKTVLYIRVAFSEADAHQDSEFYRHRADEDGDTASDIVTGDIAATLESDNIADSNDVTDASAIVSDAKRMLRYFMANEDVPEYSTLTAAERRLITPTQFRRLRKWLDSEQQ